MSEVYSDDAPFKSGHQQLQAGQRLSQARFVLQSELFRTSESSVYWLAQDRDEDSEVILYFPPEAFCRDTSLLEVLLQRLTEWLDSTAQSWHTISHIDPHSKPYPFIVILTESCDSLKDRLLTSDHSGTWEDVEPFIEKVLQHLVKIHFAGHVHGRLSSDNIRFTKENEVIFVGPQIDRIVLQILQENSENPLPRSWNLHSSFESIQSGVCTQADEVYSIASILLECIRHLGIHVQLPKHCELEGKVRFGNLLVPRSFKQGLMDALDDDVARRPSTALRLSALLGFGITDSVETYEESFQQTYVPNASERTRIFIRTLVQPKLMGALILMISIILIGWLIVDWNQNMILKEQKQARQDLSQSLALNVRDSIPSDLNGVILRGNSSLIVRTAPAEALLSLSGPGMTGIQEEISPKIWHHLQEGAHQLSIVAVGHSSTNVFPFLENGKTNVIQVELVELKTEVHLITEPLGAAFRFQDHSGNWVNGVTPGKIALPRGDYLVQFTLKGQNLTKPIRLARYQSKGVKLVGSFNACSLQVSSYPENAEVYIKDKLMGLTPLRLEELSSGRVELEIRKSGYLTRQESLTLDTSQLNTTRILLEKRSSIPGGK
ncbi:PEGA domain-containing protein [Verrucomicrobia bacterium]|nr:PEGA domain-containing protein [Verrucomicrobiota bacterium]